MIIDKDNIKILLVILIVGIGLGYAYINSDLNINGTAQINHANWDVHWSNIQVSSGSVNGSNVTTPPTISNGTTVNYSITLPVPGDYYAFTVDAVNAGSIDAMIDIMEFKINGVTVVNPPPYLNYSITYYDGTPLQSNHQLLHNTTEKYKIRVEYRDDITEEQLPTTNQMMTLLFAVTYRQVNEEAIDRPREVYTISDTPITIGQAIPNGITQYSSAESAMAAFSNRPFYLKHIVQNGVVTDTYLEFIITPALGNSQNPAMNPGTYSLRGAGGVNCQINGGNWQCDSNSPYFNANRAVLSSAFASSSCSNGSTMFDCGNDFIAWTSATGAGMIFYDNWHCYIGADGVSNCGMGD